MNFDWQSFLTFAIIGAAATYVLRRFYRTVFYRQGSRPSSCGHCCGCGPQALVTLKVK